MRSQEEMLAIILKKAKQEEHIRAALHIGAGIDEHKGPLIGGSDGGQRRP